MKDLHDSRVLAGENNPNFGVKCSEEKRQKLKNSNKEAWRDPIVRNRYLKSFKERKNKNDKNS